MLWYHLKVDTSGGGLRLRKANRSGDLLLVAVPFLWEELPFEEGSFSG